MLPVNLSHFQIIQANLSYALIIYCTVATSTCTVTVVPPSCVLPCRGEGALLCVSLEDKLLRHCRTVKIYPE